jgi:hypothetical protein
MYRFIYMFMSVLVHVHYMFMYLFTLAQTIHTWGSAWSRHKVLLDWGMRSCWIQTWGLCGFRPEAPGVFRYGVLWCVRARGSCGCRHEIPEVMVGLDMMSWKVKLWGSGEFRDGVVLGSDIYKVLWFWWVQKWLCLMRMAGVVDVVYVNTVTWYVGCERMGELAKGWGSC